VADRLSAELVRWALELYRRRPWDRVPGDAPFLIRVPGEDLPLVANVMGQARSEYGLLLQRGPGAFRSQARLILEGGGSHGRVEEWDILSATFQPLASIPPEFRTILTEARFTPRREHVAPFFLVKHPGLRPRPPGRGDRRLLLACLKGLCAADDAGELRPPSLDTRRERVLEVRVSGELRSPEVRATLVPWPEDAAPYPPLVLLGAEARDLPTRGESWFAALFSAPAAIEGDDRTVRLFALASTTRQWILAHEVLLGEDLRPAVRALERVLSGETEGEPRGKPESIAFESGWLHDAFAPALAAAGIRAEVAPLPEFLAELEEWLLEAVEEEHDADLALRMPEGLAEWKDTDVRMTGRLLEEIEPAVTPRALVRYFGSEETAEEVLEELAPLGPYPAFLEWLLSDYRATKRSKTLVEKRLERRRLAPAERALLEARRDAALSIYRVDSTEPGATLEVEDVFTGERRTIHDAALSGCGLEGFFVPLRLARVAEWTFPVLAGPPLVAIDVDRIATLLEEPPRGMPPGTEPRPRADAFGRIWGWHLDARRRPTILQNTDGDPLEPTTAVFRIDDVAGLETALGSRPDVEADGERSWVWSRPGGPAAGLGDTTILGHLALEDERLVLEVNSARRLERARAWLEPIAGVRFESAARADGPGPRALDEGPPTLLGPQGPPPGEPDPGLREEIERRLRAHYQDWLDQPLPVLGQLTPRECCRSPEGRRRVARLVRTLPTVSLPGGSVAPPREELLRRLGLSS